MLARLAALIMAAGLQGRRRAVQTLKLPRKIHISQHMGTRQGMWPGKAGHVTPIIPPGAKPSAGSCAADHSHPQGGCFRAKALPSSPAQLPSKPQQNIADLSSQVPILQKLDFDFNSL